METTDTEIIHELKHEIYHLYLEMARQQQQKQFNCYFMSAHYVVFKLEIFSPIC